MVAYLILLSGFGIITVAAAGALRDGIKARGRIRGMIISFAVMLLGLLGIVLLLI